MERRVEFLNYVEKMADAILDFLSFQLMYGNVEKDPELFKHYEQEMDKWYGIRDRTRDVKDQKYIQDWIEQRQSLDYLMMKLMKEKWIDPVPYKIMFEEKTSIPFPK